MAKLPIPFNNPATYQGHSGVDYGQPRGTTFRASGPGVVTWLGSNPRGGNFIWVKYDAITPQVGYHHMDSHDGCPREGQRFSEGDRLGYVGNTGNSTGPHLHSEVAGYATTDGYWRFFDRDRVVGSRAASGGSTTPTPTTTNQSEEDDMKLLYVTDSVDGNGAPGWALLNTRTGKLLTLRNTVAGAQDNANSWARVWGDAKTVTRQDMLNAVDGIQKTT